MQYTPRFKLGHVHLKVTDLNRAIDFYTRVLDFRITERLETYCFMTYSEAHHELAIHTVPANAEQPGPRAVGLYHFAIEVPDTKSMKAVHQKLVESGTPLRAVDHGISKVMYFSDPDGNGIEVYVDTRRMNKRYEWKGLSTPIDVQKLQEDDRVDG